MSLAKLLHVNLLSLNHMIMQMLAVLKHVPDSMSMSNLRGYIDLNLMDLYPHDCVYKVRYMLELI